MNRGETFRYCRFLYREPFRYGAGTELRGCPNMAQWQIWRGTKQDDYTESCSYHLSDLVLGDGTDRVLRIKP